MIEIYSLDRQPPCFIGVGMGLHRPLITAKSIKSLKLGLICLLSMKCLARWRWKTFPFSLVHVFLTSQLIRAEASRKVNCFFMYLRRTKCTLLIHTVFLNVSVLRAVYIPRDIIFYWIQTTEMRNFRYFYVFRQDAEEEEPKTQAMCQTFFNYKPNLQFFWRGVSIAIFRLLVFHGPTKPRTVISIFSLRLSNIPRP